MSYEIEQLNLKADAWNCFAVSPPKDDADEQLKIRLTYELEESITVALKLFRSVDEGERYAMCQQLNQFACERLLAYSLNAAALAVRHCSSDHVENGLIALALECGRVEWRFSLTIMAALYHSSEKIGADTVRMFTEASFLVVEDPTGWAQTIKEGLLKFPYNPPESRTIEAFGLYEVEGEDGFVYVHSPWGKPR